MRINLTKKEIINSIYMQIGFSKEISENLLEDIFQILLKNIMSEKKVKIAKFGTYELRKKKERLGWHPKTKEEKIFEYGENKIVLFPNTPLSWHYITDRKESKYPRRFICMRLEAKLKLHNYQTKNGKDIMEYTDIINNYE